MKDFRDGFFPFLGGAIKDEFETLKRELNPDLVFTHHRDDRHQDHRLISDLTWNTFRNHLILEYEIPKYDGDLGSPNFFVSLEESVCSRKVRFIVESFKSQSQKQWFDERTFLAILRLRGWKPTHQPNTPRPSTAGRLSCAELSSRFRRRALWFAGSCVRH